MKVLKSVLTVVGLTMTVAATPVSAQSQAEDAEYSQMLKRLTERYQDYFSHQAAQKRFEADRVKGGAPLKAKRQQYNEEAERARVAYVRNRKAAPDMSAQERQWENEQKKYVREQDKQRAAYVVKKQRLNKIEKSTRQIPQEVESGLIPVY